MGSVRHNSPTLVELAEEILKIAKTLQGAVPKSPTFFEDTLSGLSANDDSVRKQLIDATETLNALARGANGFNFSRISRIILSPYDAMSLRVIYHFRIAQNVPLDNSISFNNLAKACNVEEKLLTRLLRHAMVLHLFHEPKEGYVSHTVDSRLLATDSDVFDSVGCYLEDMGVGCQNIAKAMEKWPGSDERNHSACSYTYDTDLPFYAYLQQFPERKKRFSSMMRWVGESQAGSQTQITALYPWQELVNGTVVDMGGGNGQVIIPVARAYPSLKFIVQDLPGASEQGIKAVTADTQLKASIEFMAHDFRLEQPVKDADAYLICQCITNWSDKDLVNIFRQLVPALKPGARLLVCDRKWQALGTDSDVDVLEHRRVDMIVLVNTNGRVRTLDEILKVFELADMSFKFKELHTANGSPFMVCEMVWEP
ncbi:S-adenosyl-L-methionine-dependent methyltransferase [Hyaloscypha variabilis F]|uniref:S-adenosyl-L-methionine-dependent methyltransferase n=1 Tax=Hyaloscypha variabilis (strain UAMH 11265 / GT02V1 / F) TaxID=1149755 RepID=A0A2J6RLB5_HYAVF|nr:S-adenosyl-L-methionine-dependent methyltransferase [Hyaloscypha variabilis F]